jgi:hypothetical protein
MQRLKSMPFARKRKILEQGKKQTTKLKTRITRTTKIQEQQDEWEVEAIQDERQTERGNAEFLEKWVGYSTLTWEPE